MQALSKIFEFTRGHLFYSNLLKCFGKLNNSKQDSLSSKNMALVYYPSMIQDNAFSITHSVTGKVKEWKELFSDPLTSANRTHFTSNELAAWHKVLVKMQTTHSEQKNNTIFFILSYKVLNGQHVTYRRKVCIDCLDKVEPNWTKFTAMENSITDYANKIST